MLPVTPYQQNECIAVTPRYAAMGLAIVAAVALIVYLSTFQYFQGSGFEKDMASFLHDPSLIVAKWSGISSASLMVLSFLRDAYAAIRTAHAGLDGRRFFQEEAVKSITFNLAS